MIAFVFDEFNYLLAYLREMGLTSGDFTIERYPNQELRAQLKTPARNKDCAIVGTIAPPDHNLVEFTLLTHTLKQAGASSVVAVLPYLAYARQDKAQAGEGLGMAWAGQLLAASGIDQIISVDIHSQADAELLPIPLKSLNPAKLLAQSVKELHAPDIVIVAPDRGALERVSQTASAAGVKRVAHLEKVRSKGVTHLKLVGEAKEKAVIVDDILDTGETLISAAKQLQKAGVKEITVAVSHALFTGQDWQKLWRWGVKRIYCLDTIPAVTAMRSFRIKVIACGPLLARSLRAHLARGR
ncbi:ribose-phosphate pyrophosphokinase [Candidatus Saccharibacteria bacterium]|nr:ribose-phosphate pyrophosphokinase [Candidatus Saccharibacteria bacterium]